MKRTRTRPFVPLLLVGSLVLAIAACRNPPPTPSSADTPIIFVHGFYGSADQYRTMALYFASNGYDANRVKGFDHNSIGGTDTQQRLNAFIDATRREFGVSRVQLVGHSMGTAIVSQYMSNTTNRTKVDKYVLVDGVGCGNTGRPCLAIRAASLPASRGGSQTHVESCVSPESFKQQYQFFLGRQPATATVVPETGDTIRLAGRVQENTVNTPISNTPVRFWEVDPDTGLRVSDEPAAAVTTGSDGFFPAATVPRGRPYEIEVNRADAGTMHMYWQPFVRSDLMIRVNTAGPNSGHVTNSYRGPNHSNIAVVRNREFWHNHPGSNDGLTVQSGGQPATDVLGSATGQYVGIHLQDNAATPGRTTLAALAYFSTQPFQTGLDVFMPAATPPDGTITITNIPRADPSKPQTIHVPNWASDENGIVAEFNDWT